MAITDTMRFSYSNIGSFNNCRYGWKLTYIDKMERANNWYAEFGTYMHLILEKYFKRELSIFELSMFFKENYDTNVVASPPPFPAGIVDRYYEAAVLFFDEFDFDRNDYEVIFIEDMIEAQLSGISIVVKPDLLLKHKETGEITLIDYKTANPYTAAGKLDKKKFADYKKQLYLYSYFIWSVRGIEINKIKIWFIRVNKVEEFSVDVVEVSEVVEWFMSEVDKIKNETEFPPNNKNEFFCKMLCSVSADCIYKP